MYAQGILHIFYIARKRPYYWGVAILQRTWL